MPQYILHKRISVLNRFQKKGPIFDTNYIGKFKHHHGGFSHVKNSRGAAANHVHLCDLHFFKLQKILFRPPQPKYIYIRDLHGQTLKRYR